MATKIPETAVHIRLREAACELFVSQGYARTSVDEICAKARVTKGGFFHYFASKEEAALAALDHFYDQKDAALTRFLEERGSAGAQRVLDHIEFLSTPASMRYRGCLIGMLALEASRTNATIRKKCDDLFGRWKRRFADEIHSAGLKAGPLADPAQLATTVLALFEGALILAKSAANPKIAAGVLRVFQESLKHQLRT